MKNTKILLLLFAVLATGCHTTRKAATAPEPVVEEVVLAPAPKRTYTVMTFEGNVEGVNVNGQLRIAEDSVMWVAVYKLIEVGRAMCTPDSLWLRAPLLGHDDAMDYADLRRMTGFDISYDEMQQMALAPDAEQRLAALAHRLGIQASVHILQRRHMDYLSFPYDKPLKP